MNEVSSFLWEEALCRQNDEGMTTWSFFHCYMDYYNAFVKCAVEFNNFMKNIFYKALLSPLEFRY